MHYLKIAHWDIKPQNILIDACYVPLLTDFGSSKVIGDSETGTQTGMMGTIFFMAPEVAYAKKRKEIYSYDPIKADMWSVGISIYWILTGEYPFDTSD